MSFAESVAICAACAIIFGIVFLMLIYDYLHFSMIIKETKQSQDAAFNYVQNMKLRSTTDGFPWCVKNRLWSNPIKNDYFEELRKSTMLEF